MSLSTKQRAQCIQVYLNRANEFVNDAIANAKVVGDKVLIEKIVKVESDVKEITSYIKSKTGEQA